MENSQGGEDKIIVASKLDVVSHCCSLDLQPEKVMTREKTTLHKEAAASLELRSNGAK
jgi:hypothetical protein